MRGYECHSGYEKADCLRLETRQEPEHPGGETATSARATAHIPGLAEHRGNVELRGALDAALGCGLREVRRLSYAQTTVRFRLADATDGVTLLLDRRPPQVAANGEVAEINIDSALPAAAFVGGALRMPAALVDGTSPPAAGPRYLESIRSSAGCSRTSPATGRRG